MGDPDRSLARRGFLRSLAVASLAGLAGCGGDSLDPRTDDPTRTDGATPPPSPAASLVTDTPEGPRTSFGPNGVKVSTRGRIAELGATVQPAVARFETDGRPTEVAGVFLEPSLVVTAASALNMPVPPLRTVDGRTYEATLLDRTSPSGDRGDDVAALRVDTEEPTLPDGSAAALSPGDILIHVGHHRAVGTWLVQFGRLRERTPDDERLTTFFPLPTPGGPVVTLTGELVGVVAETVGADPPAPEVPPPTEAPRVYTDRSQWVETQFEPLSDVQARVTEWIE